MRKDGALRHMLIYVARNEKEMVDANARVNYLFLCKQSTTCHLIET